MYSSCVYCGTISAIILPPVRAFAATIALIRLVHLPSSCVPL
jgi:hypothetical protein